MPFEHSTIFAKKAYYAVKPKIKHEISLSQITNGENQNMWGCSISNKGRGIQIHG